MLFHGLNRKINSPHRHLYYANVRAFLPFVVSVATQDDEDNHPVAQGHDGAGILHQPLVGVEH